MTMKRILICKQAASPIEAHIYEHLAMTKLKHIMQTIWIITANVLNRFSDYLSSLSYTNNPYAAPDSCQIAREFGIIIGATGWEKLATTENIAKALKATHITLLYKNNITNSISCHIN